MKNVVFILLAILLAVPCAAEEKTEQPAPVLTLSVRQFEGGELKFGEISPTAFSLKNESKRAVVVLRICPVTNQGEDPVNLFGSAYGNVARLEKEDMFEYNDMVQSATQLPFYGGLLLPKEEVSVVCGYRPVSRTEEFSVEYCQAEVEYDKTAAGLKPFNVYLPAAVEGTPFKTLFKPFTHDAWEALGGSSSETDEPGPGVPVRGVLIRDLKAEPVAMRVSISMGIAEAAFPAETAREAVSKLTNLLPERFKLAYCSTFSVYFVFEESETWMLKDGAQKEKGKLLPVFPPSLVKEIDGAAPIRVRVGEKQEGIGPDEQKADWKLWDSYEVSYGDGMYTRGEFISLDQGNVIQFLEKAREKGGSLSMHFYFFKSRYYELVLPAEKGK